MCRRLCLGFLFVSVLAGSLLSVPALAAGGEDALPPEEQLTAEELYALVGIDAADEEAVEQYQVWLMSLEVGEYQDFLYAYTLAGYDPAGAAMSYALFCRLHEYEPTPATVTQNQYYTRYTGEDVALTYYKTADYGYPAGSWVLGTPGRNGTNGYFETRIINLTEIQEEVKNAVTYSDLSPLTTILNTINTSILAGNKTMSDYLPGISTILNRLTAFKDYLATTAVTFYAYPATGNVLTEYKATGLLDLLAKGFSSVNYTQQQMHTGLIGTLTSQYQDWSQDWSAFDRYLRETSFFSISTSSIGLDGTGSGTGSLRTFTGLLSVMHSDFGSVVTQLENNAFTLVKLMNGIVSSSVHDYTFGADGKPVVSDTVSSYSVLPVLAYVLDRISENSAALRYVLADEDAIRLHAANKPMEGAVEDGFTGDGSGAASVDDIKDAAALTGAMKGLFDGNSASSADFFRVAGDDGNYDFFSQPTAAALDGVSYPAVAQVDLDIEAWLAEYEFDEQGFGSLRDTSYFSLADALRGD